MSCSCSIAWKIDCFKVEIHFRDGEVISFTTYSFIHSQMVSTKMKLHKREKDRTTESFRQGEICLENGRLRSLKLQAHFSLFDWNEKKQTLTQAKTLAPRLIQQ